MSTIELTSYAAQPRSTSTSAPQHNLPFAAALFLLASGATLTIGNIDPTADLIFECLIGLLAIWHLLLRTSRQTQAIAVRFSVTLALLGLWGFAQLQLSWTEDVQATWRAGLQGIGLAATGWAATGIRGAMREKWLEAMAVFGAASAVLGVLNYYTAPGQILWLVETSTHDVWGLFLTRNRFAQFLELCLPVALWLTTTRRNRLWWAAISVVILGAGLASGSRAGALILTAETLFVVLLSSGGWRWGLVGAGLALGAVAGLDTTLQRFAHIYDADRANFYRATVAMVLERPWTGFGLGSFERVYPEFAVYDPGLRVNHAHNDWLEWAAEGGVGYAALWLVLASTALRSLRRHFWGLGVCAILLHALVDFPMTRFGIAAWVMVLLGMLESDLAEAALGRPTNCNS
jgi:O-antigen ligase